MSAEDSFIGKRVRSRAYKFEGVVVAETDNLLKLRKGSWPFYFYAWVSRSSANVVRT